MLAYLDSCVIIYLCEKREPWNSRVRRKLLATQPTLAVSDLGWLECRVGILRGLTPPSDQTAFDALFRSATTLALDRAAFEVAAQLRADHGLTTPDAIHLGCAIRHGCDEFWTNDRRRFEAAAAGRLQVRVFDA